jgi:hypothetical protein
MLIVRVINMDRAGETLMLIGDEETNKQHSINASAEDVVKARSGKI